MLNSGRTFIGQVAISSLFAAACVGFVSNAAAQTPPAPGDRPIAIELNKIEPAGTACQGYFVLHNNLAEELATIAVNVAVFRPDGGIVRVFEYTEQNLRAGGMRVSVFNIAEGNCTDIGWLLLNGVSDCTLAGGAALDNCARQVRVIPRPGTDLRD